MCVCVSSFLCHVDDINRRNRENCVHEIHWKLPSNVDFGPFNPQLLNFVVQSQGREAREPASINVSMQKQFI